MISTALEFVHARKWLVELILLVIIVGATWWFCHHLVDVGVQRQKDADAHELVKLQHAADVETGRLQGIADAAHAAQEKEHADNLEYRRTHPLHGGLCNAHSGQGRQSEIAPAHGGDEGTSTDSGPIQSVSAGNSDSQHEADQLGMLDLLAARCDAVSSQLREYQAR